MAEYIDRKGLRKALYDADEITFDGLDIIDNYPAADVQPVKHGKNLKEEWSSLFECSICHWSCWDTYCNDTSGYDYCPNCGAKMDGDE